MRPTRLVLILPAMLALAACGQSAEQAAAERGTTGTDGTALNSGTTSGAMADGAMTSGDGMTTGNGITNGDGMTSGNGMTSDSMAGGSTGNALNTGPGNSNTGPGNDGSAGTVPSGMSGDQRAASGATPPQ